MARKTDLLLFVQHYVRFEAGNAGELFIAHRAGEVRGCVCGLVKGEVELHIVCLRALVTSVRLQVKQREILLGGEVKMHN